MKSFRMSVLVLLFAIAITNCQNLKDDAAVDDGSLQQGGQSIVINNGGSSLEIRYAGNIQLNNDETAISQISPGGFVHFKKNELSLSAEPNKEGQVQYVVHERRNKVTGDKSEKILRDAIREMIANGLFANERAERLYRSGGTAAVLNEVTRLHSDAAKGNYFKWLLSNTSVPASEIATALTKMGTSVNTDMAKGDLLNKVAAVHFKDPATVQAYLTTAGGIKEDMSKGNGLRNISAQTLTNDQFDQLMQVTGTIHSDMEKGSVLKRLIDEKQRTEQQWISLINQVAKIWSGMEKSEVLYQIAQKMPAGDKVRTAYTNAAKTLKGMDYEKAIKALK